MADQNKIDPKLIRDWVDVQKQQVVNAAKENEVKIKEIESNTEYANRVIDKQHDLLKNKPRQDRYSLLVGAAVVMVFLVFFAGFLLYLLSLGKDELVNDILTWMGRIVIIIVTFVLGRLSKPSDKNKDDSTPSAVEVLE